MFSSLMVGVQIKVLLVTMQILIAGQLETHMDVYLCLLCLVVISFYTEFDWSKFISNSVYTHL